MKKSMKLTTICTCLVAFFASLILSLSFLITPAKADTKPVFQMEYGASVKLSKNGLRFKAKMSQDYYDLLVTNDPNDDVLLYGYIAPIEVLDSMTEYSDFINGGKRVGGELDQDKIYQGEDGYYYANIVMTNLDTYNYQNKSFSAIIFIEDNRDDTVYIYPELALDEVGHINIEAQNRLQYNVVNAAFLDSEERYESKLIDTYGSWYGTEEYPIAINTETEYQSFVSKLEDAAFKAKIEGRNVFVKEGLGDITSVVSVTKVSGHTVTFWDGNKVLDIQYVSNGANATAPAAPAKDGYEFVEWNGNLENIQADTDVYAKWKVAKGNVKDLGNMSVYGVVRADGSALNSDADVLGKKVVLLSGALGDGAYYPNETDSKNDPTDENKTADQAYLAYDGQYGFNDYFVADFTGKNMPTMAFFANNYNNSIFYGDGTKNGVVVATGLTWPNGLLFTEPNAYSTSVFNGKGLCMWGPHMIYSTAKNDNSKGVLLHQNVDNVAIGRENLVSGTHYRVIMGFQPGDDPSNMAIKLVYVLYDLDNDCVVESREENTYNFFTNGWAKEGQTRDQFCLGSIVAYGYFGTTTVLDKTYAIYEDTTIGEISRGFGMKTQSNTTANGDSIVLGESGIGDGANYTLGQNNGGYVNQSYYALTGDYNLNDYVAFDFTGKNMPEIAFFAKNYNNSMYAEGTSKQGIVVVTGITTWDGQLGSGVNGDGTQINYGFPYMIQDAANGGFCEGSFANSKLGRANLVDGTHYRVIMGFTEHAESARITLKWCLYNLDTNTVVEESSMSSWGFFSGSNAQVGNMTRDQLSGSIVLYGKFGVTCTIDKLYGVYEDSNISKVMTALAMNLKTVTFNNYDGTPLQETQVSAGETPVFSGETPYRPGDAVFSSYEFVGWDKELSEVTDDVTYTAVFTGTARENVTFSGGPAHTYGVEQSNNKIVLKASGIGDGANYTQGQNNGGYVHQSYLALDGNYALNDYVALDFTGKNMPEIAFFAKNYDDSMYANGTSKQGIVFYSGITDYQGNTISVNADKPLGKVVNYGFPYMLQDATNGGFCQGAHAESALARENLVDGTHYRVILGFTGSGSAITLNWYLYNLDTNAVVEQSSMTTWNFFTGGNAQVGNMTINDLSGSIVFYGRFGVACTLDKVHGVFENTDIATVASGLNDGTTYTVTFEDSDGNVWQEESLAYGAMPEYKGETPIKASGRIYDYTFIGWDKSIVSVTSNVTYTAVFERTDKEDITSYNTTLNGESIVLGAGGIGDGANYTLGQNNGGYVNQSYLALDGSYALNDYVAFDFTGKNMPEVAFFAQNYNNSMYAEGTTKQGIVVVTGITTWDGQLGSGVNNNGTQINYGFPYMIQDASNGGFVNGAFAESALGRANLVDGTHYRVIMGFTGSDNVIVLHWCLYNLDTKEIVERSGMATWGFFSGGNAQVGNMTIGDLVGSIVLYGKFGTTCTIDNLFNVFEDTTLDDVIESIITTEEEGGEIVVPSNAPDYSKYTDQFDFYAYSCYSDGTYEIDGQKYYVGKNLANLKQYAMYGDVGMTIYFPQNDMLINGTEDSIANAKALIDDLAKVGIKKTILQDNRILNLSMTETAIVGNGCQFADNDALDAYIYDCVKDYATYPGVYGVQLGDEPKYACLSAYAAVYNSLKRVNTKYGFNLFIQYNLNPLNVTQDVYDNYYPATSGTYEWKNYRYTLKLRDRFTDCVTRYTQYINDFLDAMNPDSIMYDDYPIREDKNGNKIILDSYIPCLQIVAKAAADRGIKFYHITQTHENNADGVEHKREVTEAGAKWLNNILIGFGAKQLAYYTYYTRSESDSTGGESYIDGQSFVDYNGNPTPLYDWMKGILANNQKFAPTVLQFDYKGSKTYGSANHLAEVTVSDSFAKLSNFSVSTGSALVTELYDDENNNYMYMAMNVLDPDASSTAETVTMTFNGYTHVLVYVDGVATEVALTNGVYTATLTNGDAVYVIPYNA